jgi:hypothetical protein
MHVALSADERSLGSLVGNGTMDGAPMVPSLPDISDEFLGSVALNNQILEPHGSVILTPPEKDAFAPAPAEEDSDESFAMSVGPVESDETDGGERHDVADLF